MNKILPLTLAGTVLAAGVLLNESAQAGGIGLYEIAGSEIGLASAGYAARAQDASTVFKNPAGMSLLGTNAQIQTGLQLLYGNVEFSQGASTPNTKSGGGGGNAVGAMPGASFFYSQMLTEKVAVGFGTFSYFGLAENYDDDWAGRYYVQKGTLLGMSLMPGASVKVNDWLSVGASLNAMYGYLNTEVAIDNGFFGGSGDGQLKVKDTTWGFGGVAGIILTPREGTRIGVTYVSPVQLDFSDRPEYDNAPFLSADPRFNKSLDLGITVPQSVMVGIYQDLNEHWAVMADVGWQQWSEFGAVEVGYNGNSLTKQLHYDDTWHGAVGAKYTASDKWAFTGGVAYDSSAVDDQNRTVTLPMGEAYRFGLGTEYQMTKSLKLNLAYEFMWCGDMSVNQQGGPARGDIVGSYDNAWFSFFTASVNWRF
jgi:long-chain fatty acid transport protein